MNLFTSGIPLGRWFGITVTIHWSFFLGLLYFMRGDDLAFTVLAFLLLFSIVLMHEFGHSFACKLMKGQADHIVLWPLGGLAFVNPPAKPLAHLVTTAGGPLVNVLLIPVFYGLFEYGIPAAFDAGWKVPQLLVELVWTGQRINLFLLIFNLLPVYPLDGGRIVQEILWFIVGYPKSLLIAGMVGTAGGIAFIGLGLGLFPISITVPLAGQFRLGYQPSMMLAVIGLMAAFESWRVYQQAQTIQHWRKR